MDFCDETSKSSRRTSSDDADIVSYIQVRVLGKGAHGRAVLYRNATDNSLVVWKEIAIDENKNEEIRREINILSILDHPNIVAYYNHFVNFSTVFIEMEYANSGSLSSYINQLQTDLSESDILWYFFQLIYGLEYIHKLQIIHRDIKTLNIFMTSSSLIKIGDFGISKLLGENELAETQVGTPVYMSPEVLQGVPYSGKSDIWASGCVLYELITRRKLFEYSNQLSLVMKIINRDFQKMPNCKNPDLLDLLQKLLLQDPKQRPSAPEILTHKVWGGNQNSYENQIQKLHQINIVSRPHSGDKKDRSVVSLNSEVFVWGGGKSNPIKIEQFKETDCALKVDSGRSHFAVLTLERDLYTWTNIQGNTKLSGQLGHGENVYKTPKLVQDLKGIVIKEVSCGAENTCCLSSNGEIYSCGSNYYGQLGLGSESPDMVNKFVKIRLEDPNDGTLVPANQIHCGYYHVAAIAGDEDLLFTWGCGEYGRLGLGHEEDVYKPTLVAIPLHKCKLKTVYCGYDTTFIIHKCTDRLLACGNNEFNKLGINISTKGLVDLSQQDLCYDVPFETNFKVISSLRGVKVSMVSSGHGHTVVLDIYNKLFLFGDNRYGQLGLGDVRARHRICQSSKVLAGKKIERISCGDYFTIVSSTGNEIFGWGRADNGRLGLETIVDQKCVLYPRPLFGALQTCADIKSFGWQTIIITERVLETNTISVSNNSTAMGKLSFKNSNSFEDDSELSNTLSSEIQPWLQAELEEAEVIYINEAKYHSQTTNQLDDFICDCGCTKCHDRIQMLIEQLKYFKNKNKYE